MIAGQTSQPAPIDPSVPISLRANDSVVLAVSII